MSLREPAQSMSTFRQAALWSGHIAMNMPDLLVDIAGTMVASYCTVARDRPQILVGTHHKVLTVFFGRVFRIFAGSSRRSWSRGKLDELDYASDVLLDHHSQFDFGRTKREWQGLHVVRDPRDLLISAATYHLRASEAWLHVPMDEFGGLTYQQYARALPDMEQRLLFEIDHSGGRNIAEMLSWTYNRPGMVELRYEDLVGPRGTENFARALTTWQLTAGERRLLVRIFEYFAIGGPGAEGNIHIRNPQSGQWRSAFTQAVREKFNARFPNALEKLAYAN
jgi:hypothetical protein